MFRWLKQRVVDLVRAQDRPIQATYPCYPAFEDYTLPKALAALLLSRRAESRISTQQHMAGLADSILREVLGKAEDNEYSVETADLSGERIHLVHVSGDYIP